MPTGLASDRGFIGSGDLMVLDLENPAGGFRPIGNATLFQLTPKVEQLERKSFQRATRGQTLDTFKRMDGVDLRIEVDTFGRENLALALAGTAQGFTQAAREDGSAELTLRHGLWVELGAYNVSDVAIVGHSEGEDFLVKPEAGMVMALAGGAIADNSSVTVTFKAAAVEDGAYSIDGGARPDILLQLRLDGRDDVTGRSVITDVWRVRVSPTEAFSFITGEFNKLVLTAAAETPEGRDSPFRTRVLPALA